jgi:feruloyl-CoA synthase
VLRSPDPLQPYARCVPEWLERWSRETPHVVFLAERAGDGWRELTYGDVRQQAGAVAQAILDLGLPADKPAAILSDNSIDHALLSLACQYIGRPVCSVSSAYSKQTSSARIRAILDQLDPALIFADNPGTYGAAVRAWDGNVPVIYSRDGGAHPDALRFGDLLKVAETPAVMAACDAVQADDHAKYLLTSGSTAQPKIVINTHRMLCANQQALAQCWPFVEREPPIVLDWLPWSHTFGSNHNFNIVLRNGGSLYIDDGRPAPGLIEKTVANLRSVRPTMYFNVPRGYDALLPFLEADDECARAAFSRLRTLFYAAAALPQSTWERLEAVAQRAGADSVWFTSSWGSTETSPMATTVHWHIDRAGCIGLPAPGMAVKFVPNGAKLEMRVRGPSVFPGYRNAPELTAQAFDEEGYYRIGDAGRLVNEAQPEAGIVFDGRVVEDFKLTTGTWVSVGTLRVRAVAALAPLAQDVVVTGHDRNEVGLLVFPSPQARQLPAEKVADLIRIGLGCLRDEESASSRCPTRALLLDEAASLEAGEITDKGYINQRAVLERRAADVLALYATAADPRVILVDDPRKRT